MKVKILGISGSPRRGGNTEQLLDQVLEGAKDQGAEIEKVVACDLSFSPCIECGHCSDAGECQIEDDMQDIYPKLLETDVIIIASPIFFKGIPAQLKALIDRCQCLWARKYVLNQPLRDKPSPNLSGVFVSCGGLKTPKTFDGAILTVKSFFIVLEIPCKGEFLYHTVDNKDDIQKVDGALEAAFELGKKLGFPAEK